MNTLVDSQDLVLAVLIFGVALLYSSVGHAGASGYLAAMALVGITPGVMKPTALSLNILVAAITSFQFYRAGRFSWSLFWPFALTSIPFAFVGGRLSLPGSAYKVLVGLMLLYASYRLFRADLTSPAESKQVPVWLALILGAAIGLLSGLTGVGGGIFLSPLLLLMGWADARRTAGVAAVFILVNSIAGLAGHLSAVATLPRAIPLWALAAITGGWIGSRYGSRQFGNLTIRRLLAVVLIIAGAKMILTSF